MTPKNASKRRGPKPSVSTQQVHAVIALSRALGSYKEALQVLKVDRQGYHTALRRARELGELGRVEHRRISATEYSIKVVTP